MTNIIKNDIIKAARAVYIGEKVKEYPLLKHKTLGEFLKFRRKLYGFTQKEMGEALGVSYQQYQKYEYDLICPLKKNALLLSKKLQLDEKVIPALAKKNRL